MAINLGVCSHFFTSILMMTGAFGETSANVFKLVLGMAINTVDVPCTTSNEEPYDGPVAAME